jgi:hypothetical protein
MVLSLPTFTAGMVLSISLIMAIGPQNAHVLRTGLQRQHLWLTVAVCAVADIALIALGVLSLAQLGGLSDKLHGALVGAGMLFLTVYGWQAFQRFLHPTAWVLNQPEDAKAEAGKSKGHLQAAPRHTTPSAFVGAGLFMAQPARLAGHGRADRHRIAGLWARQHQFWPGRGSGFDAVVPELGRGRLLAGSAPELAARLARTGRRSGADDVGHSRVVGLQFGLSGCLNGLANAGPQSSAHPHRPP